VPKQALKRCCELLHSPHPDLRRAAAHGLRLLKGNAEPALNELVEAICREQDREILLELGEACASLGQIAAKPLCDAVKTGGFQRLGTAGVGLILLGRAAAVEIATNLVAAQDEIVRATGIALLRSMKSDAKPALAELAKSLPGLNNERAAEVLTLFAAHPSAADIAAPAMLNCFLERGGEISDLAGRMLEKLGTAAMTVLESRLENANPSARLRLEKLLDRMRPNAGRTFDRLLKLNADPELLLFVFAGEVIDRNGPIGLRQVGTTLESVDMVKAMKLPTSEAALRGMLTKLHQRLGVPLTFRVTKGTCITSDGRDLLVESREYLRSRGYHV
jgi:hypothetical protein